MKGYGGWSGLYSSDDPAGKMIGSNPFTQMVMTPYQLDSIVNKLTSKEADSKLSTMALNKRSLEKTAPFYEDNSLSATATFKLLTQEEAQTREQTRTEAIRGFDPEYKLADPNEFAKLPANEQMKVE